MSDASLVPREPFRPDLIYKYAALLIVAMLVLVPLGATVARRVQGSLNELRVNAFGWPRQFEWEAYVSILTGRRFWQYLWNSAVITVCAVTLTVGLAALAGFVFACLNFRGRDSLLAYFTVGLMFRPPPRARCALHQGARTSACSTPTGA